MVLLSGMSSTKHVFLFIGCILRDSYNVLQPMMGSMQALSTVVQKASTNNFAGSAVLNLLQSQVKFPYELFYNFSE